jgi:hypothetical protein
MGSTSSSPSITPPPATALGVFRSSRPHGVAPSNGQWGKPRRMCTPFSQPAQLTGLSRDGIFVRPWRLSDLARPGPWRVVPAPGAKARHRVPAGETGRTHAAETRDEGERAVAAACYLEDLIELDRRPRHRGGRSAGRGKADPEQLPARRRPARHDLDAGHSGHPATPLPPGPHPWQAARVLRKRPPQAAVPVRV